MSLYDLPEFNIPKINVPRFSKHWSILIILIVFISSFFGFLAGVVLDRQRPQVEPLQISQEEAIINVVKNVSPAVVSIIITKDLPIFEKYYINPFEGFEKFFEQPFRFEIPKYRQRGVEQKRVGSGTGFIISAEGIILTNKHVVLDKEADYTILMNDSRRFKAEVLARDRFQDLAILKIEGQNEPFPVVELGRSDNLQIGQTVIAIGNVLGEFQNTVSVGVVSGLGRTITARGGGIIATLRDVIQTDAAINRGNSGGPLLDLNARVVGINTAMSLEGENIGFAIPVNRARKSVEQVKTFGRIIYPFLGVRYLLLTPQIQMENNLPVDYGAWIIRGNQGEPAVYPGSAAEKAGLKQGDIILEFNNERISVENSLAEIIVKYNPGDKIVLKILRNGNEKIIEAILGEHSE